MVMYNTGMKNTPYFLIFIFVTTIIATLALPQYNVVIFSAFIFLSVVTFAYNKHSGTNQTDPEGFLPPTKPGPDHSPDMLLALDFADEEQYDKAIDLFDKVIKAEPNNSMAFNERGFSYFSINQYEQALADFSRALEINPESPASHKYIALCNNNIPGNEALGAQQYLDFLIEVENGKHPHQHSSAIEWATVALSFHNIDQSQKALDTLDLFVNKYYDQHNPYHVEYLPRVQRAYGLILNETKQYQQALEWFLQLNDDLPRSKPPRSYDMQIAETYLLLKNKEQAQKYFDRHVKIFRGNKTYEEFIEFEEEAELLQKIKGLA